MPIRWPRQWTWLGNLPWSRRRTAARALRASEAKFASIFAVSPQAISITAIPSGRFLDVNEALLRLSGYSRDELIGRTPLEVALWADRREWELGRDTLLREGRLSQREVHFRRKDGGVIVALVAAERIDIDGQPAILTVVADITARKRAEERLRASEERYRAVQETTPDGFMIFESVRQGGAIEDFRWVYLNPAAERIVGRTAADLLGRQLLVEMPGNRIEGLFDAYVRVVEEGEVWQREFAYAHEGLDRWFRSTAARAGDGFAVSFADITEHRRAEEGLRASEERYRTLVESVEEGVCILEMIYDAAGRPCDYRFLEVNPTFERHTGLKDAAGKTARALVPDLEDHWVARYGEIAETGQPQRFSQGSAAMGRWFEVEAVRIGGEGSRRVAVLFTDVTERRRSEAALQDAARQATFRAALNDTLRPLVDPAAIQAEAGRLLGEHLGANRVHYGEVTPDDAHIAITRCYVAGVAELVGTFRLDDFGPSFIATLRAGRTLVVPDVAASPDLSPSERAASAGIEAGAAVGVPLVKTGRFAAILAVHQREPRAWTAAEVALIEEVAERTWAAIERARTEAALRASEYRLRIASEAAGVGIHDYDVAKNRVQWDDTIRRIWGVGSDEEITYETFVAGLHPADLAATEAAVARALDPAGDRQYHAEYRVIHRAGGRVRWVAATGQVFFAGNTPLRLIGTAQDITARREAEERVVLLGEVSTLLAGALDEDPALGALARLLVRGLADWCMISTLEPDGQVHRRAHAHVDPARESLLRELPGVYPYDPAQPYGPAGVLASGRSRLIPALTPQLLADRTSAALLPTLQDLAVASGMIVPLRARGTVFGAVSLFRIVGSRPFDEADLSLAEQIAERAAVTLDGVRLYAAERSARAAAEQLVARQAAQAEAIRLFAEAGLALEPLLATTARYLTDLLGDGCVIGLVRDDGEQIELVAADNRDPEVAEASRRAFVATPLRVGTGLIGGAVATGRAALLPVVDQERLSEAAEPGLRPLLARFAPYSLMAAPCRVDGRAIGVIAVARQTPGRPYTTDDLDLLSDLADRAALAIERARLYDAERRAREQGEAAQARLALLAEAGIVLTRSLDEEATLASLVDLIVPGFADWCTVNLIGDDALRPPIARHADPARQPALAELLRRYPADIRGNGPLARVLRTGEPLLLLAQEDEVIRAYAPDESYLDLLTRVGLTATIIVPLVAQQRLMGALRFARMGDSPPYDADDLRLAEEIARRAALALDNARLYRETREAVFARDRFLSIAAHELRTPVTSMRAYAQLARRRRERDQLTPELVDSALASIDRGTARLNILIQDLLDVARLQSGQLRVERTTIDLAALVATAAADAQTQFPAGLTLTVVGTDQPYPIQGDAGRLEQVLGNLLENARKYSPEGGAITLALETDERGATVTVRDEGIGLDPGEERTIFTPFNRSEEAQRRQIQGLGLGLAICRAIVEEHGGTLTAASAGSGRGTAFTLWLPALG